MRKEITGKCIIHELARALMTGSDKSPSVSWARADSSLSSQSIQLASCFPEQESGSHHSSPRLHLGEWAVHLWELSLSTAGVTTRGGGRGRGKQDGAREGAPDFLQGTS